MKNIQKNEMESDEILKSLKENNKLYESLLNTTPEGVIITNLEGKILSISDKVLEFSKFDSIDDFIGRDSYELVHPDDLEKAKELAEIADVEIIKNAELRALKKDGTYYLSEFNASLVKDDEGKPLAYLITIRDITERKKIEQMILERERTYRNLYENALVGLWKCHINRGSFIRANKTVAKIIGYDSPEELMEKSTIYKVFSNEALKLFHYKLENYGKINEFETKFTDVKGIEKIISISARVDPEEQTIEGVFLDITSLKSIERALESSEEQYRTTLNSIVDPLFVVNKDLEIVLLNDTLREQLPNVGLDTNCIGKKFYEYFYFLPESVVDDYKKLFNTKEQVVTVETNTIKEKEYKSEVRKFPIFDENQNVKQIITLIHDTTEKNQIERKLVESEEKFKTIFEAIPDLFFMVDKETRVLEYNGTEQELYVPPDQILGNKLYEMLPPELAELSLNAIKKVFETKQPQIIEYSLPINKILCYYEARHLYFSEDSIGIFIRNITERREAEEVITREVERLKEMNKMRRDLITRVSHEIKTPLMSINGAVEILIDSGDKFEVKENLDFLSMVKRNAERLNKMVGGLLDVTRIEYQKLALSFEECNLSNLIEEITTEMEYFLNERKIGIILDMPNEIKIKLDKLRFRQVITNLISNAIKNTPPEGRITISLEENGEDVQIQVEDTGVGLTKEELSILFERFGKIEREEEGLEYLNIQGTGLGLFISKEIVKSHKGEIWAESEGRQKGSKFIIRIPKNL